MAQKEEKMNDFKCTGRLTMNPVSGTSNNEKRTTYCQFGIAIRQDWHAEGKDPNADFFQCVAFGKTAEFIAKYFRKGSPILIAKSQIRNNNREVEGQMVYGNQIIVQAVEFNGRLKSDEAQGPGNNAEIPQESNEWPSDEEGFMNIPEGIEEEMPFS